MISIKYELSTLKDISTNGNILANVTAAQEEINSVQVRHEGRLKVLESREPRRAPTAPSRMRPGKLKTVRMLEKVSWFTDKLVLYIH